jgi:hypothetical protein
MAVKNHGEAISKASIKSYVPRYPRFPALLIIHRRGGWVKARSLETMLRANIYRVL